VFFQNPVCRPDAVGAGIHTVEKLKKPTTATTADNAAQIRTPEAAAPRPAPDARTTPVRPVGEPQELPANITTGRPGQTLLEPATSPQPRAPKQTALRLLDAPGTPATEHAWVTQLKADYEAIRRTILCHLTGEQRVTLGRYHAWRFANCTKFEHINRRKGGQIGAAYAAMAVCDQFMDLRASQIIGLCKRYAATIKDAPFFDPWLIKAVDDGWQPKVIPPIPHPISAGARS
jgi:hypothetical protein